MFSVANNTPNKRVSRQRSASSAQAPPGMSIQSRYNQNLKVLRRRDPSIVSIFDQFTYVCLYRHDDGKWNKIGYEGAMFLYERDSYPPYGFYILNRAGAEDYSQCFSPEDKVSVSGQYFMIRTFPDYTASRRTLINSSNISDKFSKKFVPPDGTPEAPVDKGRAVTFGIWTHEDTGGRVSMNEVLTRLYKFVQRNEEYPEAFKYSHWHGQHPLQVTDATVAQVRPASSVSQRSGASTPDAAELSFTPELSRLLSKLTPVSSAGSASSNSTVKPSTVTSRSVSLTKTISSQSIPQHGKSRPPNVRLPSQTSISIPSAPSTGLSLLDSIFASASQTPEGTPPLYSTESHQRHSQSEIHSPQPTTTALPQILSQDVIATLMGLPASRASSVAPSTGSSAGDGDNEQDDEDSGDVYSYDEGTAPGLSRKGHPKRPSLTNGNNSFSSSSLQPHNISLTSTSAPPASHQRKRGDETPRNRSIDHFIVPHQNHPSYQHQPPVTGPSSHNKKQPNGKQAFIDSSGIWPSFSHTPVDDTEDDIIELDFADTSLLSQPDAQYQANGRTPVVAPKKLPPQVAAVFGSVDSNQAATSLLSSLVNEDSGPGGAVNGKRNRRREKRNSVTLDSSATSGSDSLDKDAVKSVILRAATGQLPRPLMERSEFIREILTLLHTDPQFVDSLWKDYQALV
jgi:hypothetical protein